MLNPFQSWLPAWLRSGSASYHPLGIRHVLLCMCDCFDPVDWPTKAAALAQIREWQASFERFAREFGDSGGTAPRHTFFYPAQRLDPEVLDALRELCAVTGSECELRLHRELRDGEDLRAILESAKTQLAAHGLLSRDASGAVRFAFIHPAQESAAARRANLTALRESGSFADFTVRDAGHALRLANSLCYAPIAPAESARCHRVIAERTPRDSAAAELLQVSSPEVLDWQHRRFGILPRLDDGELSSHNPPTLHRFRLWMKPHIGVEGRANWHFVKLHSCNSTPETSRALLGENTRSFYRELARLAQRDGSLRFHFVTAREMVNILHAAEAAHSGNPSDFRDFRYRLAGTAPAPVAAQPEAESTGTPAPTGLIRQHRESAARSQETSPKNEPRGGVLGGLRRNAAKPLPES